MLNAQRGMSASDVGHPIESHTFFLSKRLQGCWKHAALYTKCTNARTLVRIDLSFEVLYLMYTDIYVFIENLM